MIPTIRHEIAADRKGVRRVDRLVFGWDAGAGILAILLDCGHARVSFGGRGQRQNRGPPAVHHREAGGTVGRQGVTMTPEQVAASYDQIARQWLDVSTYGLAQIKRALAFVKDKGAALDVGCGPGG
jgi:hypothetical protein